MKVTEGLYCVFTNYVITTDDTLLTDSKQSNIKVQPRYTTDINLDKYRFLTLSGDKELTAKFTEINKEYVKRVDGINELRTLPIYNSDIENIRKGQYEYIFERLNKD